MSESPSESQSQNLPRKLRQHAQFNRDLYAELPHPDVGEWIVADHFEAGHTQVATLHNLGVIRRVGRRRRKKGRNDRSFRRVWRTNAEVYRELQRRGYLDVDRPPVYGTGDLGCPDDDCGRVSFTNLDGERLECKVCGTVAHKTAWRGGGSDE
jgi:hypothetical protein